MNFSNKVYWYGFKDFIWDNILGEAWFKDIYRICAHCHAIRDHEDEQILDLMNDDKYLSMSLNDIMMYDDTDIKNITDPLNSMYYSGCCDITNALFTYPLMKKLYPNITWYVVGISCHVYVTNIPPDHMEDIEEADITDKSTDNTNLYIIADLVEYFNPSWSMHKNIFSEIEEEGVYLYNEFEYIDPLSYFDMYGMTDIINTTKYRDLYCVPHIEPKIEEPTYIRPEVSQSGPLTVPQYWIKRISEGYKM